MSPERTGASHGRADWLHAGGAAIALVTVLATWRLTDSTAMRVTSAVLAMALALKLVVAIRAGRGRGPVNQIEARLRRLVLRDGRYGEAPDV
jgi:hypothetical protein